jgi:hypothetical protein
MSRRTCLRLHDVHWIALRVQVLLLILLYGTLGHVTSTVTSPAASHTTHSHPSRAIKSDTSIPAGPASSTPTAARHTAAQLEQDSLSHEHDLASHASPSGCHCDYGSGPGTWVPTSTQAAGSNLTDLQLLRWETLDPACPMADMLQRTAATYTGSITALFPEDNSSSTAALPWEAGVEAAAVAASADEARRASGNGGAGTPAAGAAGAAGGGARRLASGRGLAGASSAERQGSAAGEAAADDASKRDHASDSGSTGSSHNSSSGRHPRQLNMLIFSDSVGERTMRAWCRYVQASSDPRVQQVGSLRVHAAATRLWASPLQLVLHRQHCS